MLHQKVAASCCYAGMAVSGAVQRALECANHALASFAAATRFL